MKREEMRNLRATFLSILIGVREYGNCVSKREKKNKSHGKNGEKKAGQTSRPAAKKSNIHGTSWAPHESSAVPAKRDFAARSARIVQMRYESGRET